MRHRGLRLAASVSFWQQTDMTIALERSDEGGNHAARGQKPDADVRILAATNANLWQHVQAKSFREDLYRCPKLIRGHKGAPASRNRYRCCRAPSHATVAGVLHAYAEHHTLANQSERNWHGICCR